MKKLLIVLSFIFLSINLNAQESDLIVGKWVFTKALNKEVDEAGLAYMKAEVIGKWKFEFYSDGKYITFMGGEKASGKWKLSTDSTYLILTGIEGGPQELKILMATKKDLALIYARLQKAHYPLTGVSDHGVSEALYLDDPDGNEVELYCDRPKKLWPYHTDGTIHMVTEPLDLEDLLKELDTL